MKKSFLLILIIISALVFQSCDKDESLDPRAQIIPGLFARLDITSKVIKGIKPGADINFTQEELDASYFGGILTSPSGKIANYNLYVKRVDKFGYASQFVLLKTITTFPCELKIYLSDISLALNIPVADMLYSNNFYFYAESFDVEGNRADYYSLSSTVQGAPGMKQAYRFMTRPMPKEDYIIQANLDEVDNYATP